MDVPGAGFLDKWKSISEFLEMHKYHHYSKNRIATQFCTFTKRKKEPKDWVACHIEDHHQTFQKLCWVVDYLIDEQIDNLESGKYNKLNLEFYYPVFVIQNKLLDIRQRGHTVKVFNSQHIGFKITKFDYGEETNYQVDVMTENNFPTFLDILDNEMTNTASKLYNSRSIINHSIKKKMRARKISKIMKLLSSRRYEDFELIEK